MSKEINFNGYEDSLTLLGGRNFFISLWGIN